MNSGDKVRIVLAADADLLRTAWWPKGETTGTIQKVFKNGKVAVAVHQLRNVWDGGDGLRTLHFRRENLEVLAARG